MNFLKKDTGVVSGSVRKIFSFFFLTFLLLSGCSRPPSVDSDRQSITIQDLRRHMEYIAADERGGRLPGSPGYMEAAEYASGQLERLGLKPGLAGAEGEGSFLQPVPFTRTYWGDSFITLRLNGQTRRLKNGDKNFEVFSPGQGNEQIPLDSPVFVGCGIHEPESGWDDFAGLELAGKIVMIMIGFPGQATPDKQIPPEIFDKYSDRVNGDRARFQNVIARGAAAILAIPDRNLIDNWSAVFSRRRQFDIAAAEDKENPPVPTIVIHQELAKNIFKDMDFDPITGRGSYRTFVLDQIQLGLHVDVKKENFTCHNVLAVVPGTHPELSKEYITVAAHLDHLGRTGEVIYNGANDDASGCVLILEVAEALAQNPLARSVMFVLFTGEEFGHAGSQYFLAHPPVPLDRMKLNINVEQIGARTRNIRGVWSIGPPAQEALLNAAHKSIPEIEHAFDAIESQVDVIRGTDTWSFYQKKMPSILIGSGGFPEHHTPEDDVGLIDFKHLHTATLFVYAYIRQAGIRQRSL